MKARRAVAAVIALVAIALIGAGTAMLLASRPPAEFGTDADAGLEASASPTRSVDAAPSESAVIPPPQVTSSPAPSATAEPAEPPRRILIPSIDVDAKVIPVGLDRARAVEVPEDISVVGWYEYSVPPGSPAGSSVLVAHRDGRVDGHGVFYDLGRLLPGDRITVVGEGGMRQRYRVKALRLLEKSAFKENAEAIFALDGPARLRLISCGGYYDPDHGGYQSNVIVTAVADQTADQSP